MSAPAMNVVPAPMSTIASAAGIGDAALRPPRRSRSQTDGASAFTGGLSMVTTATPSLTS